MAKTSDASDNETLDQPQSIRLDKWLWCTRIVKSRTLAATLISGGKVRLNRSRVDKPSHTLKVGDVVTVTAHKQVRVLKVLLCGARRGPATEAQTLYEDLTPETVVSAASERARRKSTDTPDMVPPIQPVAAEREPGAGRPTKRDRRALDRFQRSGG
ncbi:MAG: RNA-binding S4 domain-containing protein [Pseudomonadota bacterium]